MSYDKQLYGQTVSVPEPGNKNVGAAATAILDGLIDGADGTLFKAVGGVIIQYSLSAATSLTAAATLTRTHPKHVVQGATGPVTLNGTTAIVDGTHNGERLRLQGGHATNTVTILNNANTKLRGDITLGLNEFIDLEWDTIQNDWLEVVRGNASSKLSNQAALEFYELTANGTNKISIQAPAALAGDYTLTLPIAQGGANTFLKNDGSGILSWGSTTATLQGAYDGGVGITIGGGGSINVDRVTGGEVLRLRASTSGNPYLAILAGTGELRVLQTASGKAQIGTFSANDLEIMSGNTARITILSTGEIAMGVAPEAGVFLKVGGPILITNNKFLQGENTAAANQDLLGINASDQVVLGGATTFLLVKTASTEALRIDASGRVAIGTVAAVSARLHVENAAGSTPVLKLVQTSDSYGIQIVVSNGSNSSSGMTIDHQGTGEGLYITTLSGSCFRTVAQNTGTVSQLELGGVAGQYFRLRQKTILFSVTSGATSTIAAAMPAGALIRGISGRVTQLIGGATTFNLGVSGTSARYATSVAVAAGTTWNSFANGAEPIGPFVYNGGNTDLILQANGPNFTGSGQVRIVIYYEDMIVPTS